MSLNSGFGPVERSLNIIGNVNPEAQVFKDREEIVKLQLKRNYSMQTPALLRDYRTKY